MARHFECSRCGYVQAVAIVDNGMPAGYADPHATCGECQAVGTFHSAPGAAHRLRVEVQEFLDLARLAGVSL